MNWDSLINKPEPDDVSFTEFSKLSFEKLSTWLDGFLSSSTRIDTDCTDDSFLGWANEVKSAALLIIGNESLTHFEFTNFEYLYNRYDLENGFTMHTDGFIEFLYNYYNFDGLNNNYASEIYVRLQPNNNISMLIQDIHFRLNNALLKWACELVNAVMTKNEDFLDFLCMVSTDTLRIIDKTTYTCDSCNLISLECGKAKNSRINFTVCEDCGFRNATILNKYARGRNQRWRTPLHLLSKLY